jgi:hypothetical protein
MIRRDFIAGLGGAAVAWPLGAHAQQAVMPTIGFLNPGSPDKTRLAGGQQTQPKASCRHSGIATIGPRGRRARLSVTQGSSLIGSDCAVLYPPRSEIAKIARWKAWRFTW